jgi:cation diffusion facilitator family transporter
LTANARQKTKYIRIAALTALVGNGILAALKIFAGSLAGSSALIGDGIDSLADVLICAITLFVVRLISRPADKQHPWGHGRAETIATVFLSFVIFFVGAQLIFNSVSSLLFGAQRAIPSSFAVIITLVSIAGKVLLAWSQYVLGKRAGSSMIKANAKNMTGDVLISVGVLAGLVISSATGTGLADTVIALLIGVWVIKTAVSIFMEANHELMDGGEGGEEYRVIFDAVKAVSGADHPHRARMRHIAGFWDIDIDIEVNPDITVSEAHRIASRVEEEIKARLENVYDIMVHVEPHGDTAQEGFGLSESKL